MRLEIVVAIAVLATIGMAGCIGDQIQNEESLDTTQVEETGSSNETEPQKREEADSNDEQGNEQASREGEGGPSGTELPSGFSYACPPGQNTTRSDGLCFGTIASPRETYLEPYVAVHPSDPDIAAIGVNAYHTDEAARTDQQTPGVEALRVDVFVTADGGESWEKIRHPFVDRPEPYHGATESGDPALVFDEEGTLHLSALVLDPALSQIRVFYTSTSDLGDSWTQPVLLVEENGNDRNWITVGAENDVYIPWQRALTDEAAVEVAWSLDDGDSWASSQQPGCNTASPVALAPKPVVACAVQGEDDTEGIQVLELDASNEALEPIAEIEQPGATWPLLERTPDGTLHMVAEASDVQHVWYARSHDGGNNWTQPVDLREHVTIEDDWDNARAYWVTSDPWGVLHLVLSSTSEGANTHVGPTSRPVAHVALDPATLEVLESRTLSTDDPLEQLRIPPSPPLGASMDHYYGLDFSQGTGLLAWVRNNGIDYTIVEPEHGSGEATQ